VHPDPGQWHHVEVGCIEDTLEILSVSTQGKVTTQWPLPPSTFQVSG